MKKCEGNPLISLQFVHQLMLSGCVATKDMILFPDKTFFTAYELNDWTGVPCPPLMNKINGSSIDKYLKESL